MSLLNEAVEYFKSRNGFDRLFVEFEKRFKSLERIGGSAVLPSVTDLEFETIRKIIGEKLKRKGDKLSVPLVLFEEKLQETKFAGITLLELLEGYLGYKLITNKEKRNSFEFEKNEFLTDIHQASRGMNADFVFDKILNKTPGTLQVHTLYQNNKTLHSSRLLLTLKAVNVLPLKEPKRLALFATEVTGNPHYFDIKSEAGRLLISFLQLLLEKDGWDYKTAPNAEEITEILSCFGIWRDDVLNFVSCFGVRGFKDNGDSFKVLDGALEEKTFCNLPLRDVFRLKRVEVNRGKVFVVENSSLYASLIEEFQGGEELPTIICTHGRMKLSALLLLDKIAEHADAIFYSGDHDPQGLSIAQSLVLRLGSMVKLWRFDQESYLLSISDETFSSDKMLENIQEPGLQSLKHLMSEHKKAAYQEKLLTYYRDDIICELNFGK